MVSLKVNNSLHLISLITLGYAYYWIHFYLRPIPGWPRYAGQWKFLTHWTHVLQLTYHTICLICDLSGNQFNGLKRFRDFFFHGIAFPAALYVSIAFWGLYAIDRDLIFPESIEPYFPNWLNHCVHTLISVFILLESYLFKHHIPRTGLGLGMLYTYIIGYTVWTFYMALRVNLWVYPVMQVMSWPGRIAFVGFGIAFITLLYFAGIALHKKFWSIDTRRKRF